MQGYPEYVRRSRTMSKTFDADPFSSKKRCCCAVQSSLGSDTARLVRVTAADGSEEETLASNARADVGSVMISDIDRSVLAVSFNYLRREWTPLDPDVEADFKARDRFLHQCKVAVPHAGLRAASGLHRRHALQSTYLRLDAVLLS